MTRGTLGRWAVRFLAAAGVSSTACSGRYIPANEGPAGGAGSAAAGAGNSSETVDVGGAPSSAGEAPVSAGAPPVATAGTSNEAGAGGTTTIEPDPENQFPCLNPVPFANSGSGLERCDNGMIHRKTVGQCSTANPNGGGCLVDADCPATADDVGTICGCDASGVGTCRPANCDRDEVCADGFACAQVDYCPYAPPGLGFACQTPDDSCAPRAPYEVPGVYNGCLPNADEIFEGVARCHGTGGRPFLVNSVPRTARTQLGGAWLEPSLCLATADLTPGLRARLGAHWQRQAEMEHASVAAFARFVLELLSLAAPPELVSAATDALADETAHARLCYALASSYAEQPLGPTPLDVGGALSDLSREGIVTRAVLEGCVGETLAAIEASEAAAQASDPTLQSMLARIAEDEARHAELSWRFLRWALSTEATPLRDTVRGAFVQARHDLVARRLAAGSGPADAELLTHCVLPASHAAQLALTAFDAVIAPCADALLAARPSAQHEAAALRRA